MLVNAFLMITMISICYFKDYFFAVDDVTSCLERTGAVPED